MKVTALASIKGRDLNTEILFPFDALYLEDLKYYTDDIIVDGDLKCLIFSIN